MTKELKAEWDYNQMCENDQQERYDMWVKAEYKKQEQKLKMANTGGLEEYEMAKLKIRRKRALRAFHKRMRNVPMDEIDRDVRMF